MELTQKNNTISSPILPFAVLWDLDGTLIDSNECHWKAWKAEMAAQNREISRDEFSSTFGQRNDTILRGWISPQISDQEIKEISESKEARYRQEIWSNGVALLPGAAHWLQEVQAAGGRQGLATMAGRRNVEAIFSVLKIEQYFDAVVTGNDVSRGKPDPEVFLQAAERLAIPAERCIVIEDSSAGIEAARLAGMRSVGVNPILSLPANWAAKSLTQLSPGTIISVFEE